MLKFDPTNLSIQPDDKVHEFPTSIGEDPFNDLFDQFVSQDSSGTSDNDNQTSFFEALDFPADDMTSNGGRINDNPSSIYISPKTKRSQEPRQSFIRYTQSQEILPSQVYQKFARFEKPQAAISSTELLNLEGKLPAQVLPVRSTSSLASIIASVPPLRRKTRFSANPPETLRYRNHKVSKSSGAGTGEAPKMTPPYFCRHEMPSFQERFEKISLQPPRGDNPPTLPLSPEFYFRDEKRPRNVPTARSSQQNLRRRETSDLGYMPSQEDTLAKISEFDNPIPPTISSPFNGQTQQNEILSFNAHRELKNRKTQSVASPPPSLSPSWLQSPTSTESVDFTISPNQIQSSWTHDLPDSYYGNVGASQSAPVLPQSGADFSSQYPIVQFDSFEPFVTKSPSNIYDIAPEDLFQPTDFDMAPPLPSPKTTLIRPQTPSTRSSSLCTSPSHDPKTQSKNHRRSKSSRRKSSAGALKPSTGLGFVNFTPGDSQKILSGVAPSGSSKTKARREQEANEKKRKLSLAAEKAIKEAGGDVEQLRATGLFS